MEAVAFLIMVVLAFVNGYFIGKWNAELKEEKPFKKFSIKKFNTKAYDKILRDSYVGAVHRPNAEKLDRIRNPKKYEGEDETKRVLDELSEK